MLLSLKFFCYVIYLIQLPAILTTLLLLCGCLRILPLFLIGRLNLFKLYWTKDEDCFEFFNKLWLPDPSPSVDSVREKLSFIFNHLLDWSKNEHGNLMTTIRKLEAKLEFIDLNLLGQTMRKQNFKQSLRNFSCWKKTIGKPDLEQIGS